MTYNKSKILKYAWKVYRNQNVRTMEMFSNCMKQAWRLAKVNPKALEPVTLNINDLYKRYYKGIFYYLNTRVKSVVVAEEITNDTFIKVNNNLSSFNSSKGAVSTWIYNIAHNCMIDYFRMNNKKIEKEKQISDYYDAETGNEYFTFISDTNVEKEVEDSELKDKIINVFNKLKPNQKMIAELFFIHHNKYDEIAEKCNISMNNVKVLINRLRKRLQEELQHEKVEYSIR